MSGKMELLAGPAVKETLKSSDVTVFEYAVNQAGLVAVLVAAVIFYALAGVTWWISGLDEGGWAMAFVCLIGVGVGFSAMAAYWHQYATQNVVGFSDERFFVGNEKGLWAISWDLLDEESMGFGSMNVTRYGGGLLMNVGGQKIKVHLANAVAYLENLEEFMGGVLLRLLTDEEREELAEKLAEQEAREAEEAALAAEQPDAQPVSEEA